MMPSSDSPPPNRPNPNADDAGPYAQQPFDARGRGESASILFAAIAVAVHALLLGATILATMIVGARCEKVFRDFNMKPDAFTAFALGVSRWLSNYWYVLVIVLLPALLAEGGLLYLVHRWRPSRPWSYVLAALILFLILSFAGCMTAALVPYVKLVEDLSR